MAKKSGKNQRQKYKNDIELEEREEAKVELDEDAEDLELSSRQRKRSQAPFKLKLSKKKQDMLVIIIACILIGVVSLGYFYYAYSSNGLWFNGDGDDSGGNGNETNIQNKPLYDGELQIVSDVTHNWDKSSWHLMNYLGETQFMLRIENTGLKDDTYKLSDNNLIDRIQLTYSENNIPIKSGQASLVIVDVVTDIDYNYRIPTSIEIKLKSDFTRSFLDSVKIDLTINELNTEDMAVSGDKVAIYYSRGFENGTLFDYSFKDPNSNTPLYISLSESAQNDKWNKIQYNPEIQGLRNGIIGMLPGETHVIEVPPELGYPPEHNLGGITLIFEVRLLSNDRNL